MFAARRLRIEPDNNISVTSAELTPATPAAPTLLDFELKWKAMEFN